MTLNCVPLGPPVEGCDEGVYQKVRILDSLDHINPWKRPPQEVWKCIKPGIDNYQDSRPERAPLVKRFQGKPITQLHNIHSGRVAILFNGNSLAEHDLGAIDCPIIGMNRTIEGYPTYYGPKTDYHVFIDVCWLNKEYVRDHPGLINASSDMRYLGYRVHKAYRMKPFSFDLDFDGAVPVTTGFVALQVAAYMGFTEIYCLGLDLQGKHFDGTDSGQGMQKEPEFQAKALPLLHDRGIKVYRCGTKDSLSPFPYKPFDEVFY